MYPREENPGRYWCQGSTTSSVLLRPFRKSPSSPIPIISRPYSCVLLILHNTSRSGVDSRRGLPLGGRSLGEKPICTICPASQSLPLRNRLDPFRHRVNFGEIADMFAARMAHVIGHKHHGVSQLCWTSVIHILRASLYKEA